MQIGSAVDEWNGNISVVTDGFNSGLDGATPALVWLSNIAEGVFDGLGWFGNIYFFLGFLSVFFLIMSKSGLAGKINGVIIRGGK